MNSLFLLRLLPQNKDPHGPNPGNLRISEQQTNGSVHRMHQRKLTRRRVDRRQLESIGESSTVCKELVSSDESILGPLLSETISNVSWTSGFEERTAATTTDDGSDCEHREDPFLRSPYIYSFLIILVSDYYSRVCGISILLSSRRVRVYMVDSSQNFQIRCNWKVTLCIFGIINSFFTLLRAFSFAFGGLQAAVKVVF